MNTPIHKGIAEISIFGRSSYGSYTLVKIILFMLVTTECELGIWLIISSMQNCLYGACCIGNYARFGSESQIIY
jgi:hypothetical protein